MSLTRSLAWMGGAQAASLLLQFASTIVLARLLTPLETGIYAVGAATAGVLSILQAFGLQGMIVRERELTRDIEATAFTVNALISIALALAIAAAGLFGSSFLHNPGVGRVLRVLALGALFGIVTFLPTAKLEREGRFKAISVVQTASGVINTVSTILLASLGFSYMSIAYAGLGSGLAYAVMINIAGREHVRFRVSRRAWRPVANYGLQMLAVSGVNSVALRLSDVALGRIQGLSALGYYSRAGALNGLLWSNIHMVIGRVVFVDYARLVRNGLPLRERYMQTVEVVTAVLWPSFAGFALLAAPFIRTVYGERWVPAARPLAMLAIASIILVSITMTWELFTATGRLREQTRIEFIRSSISVLLFTGGCTISLTAAAAARIAEAVIALLIYRPHLNRMTDTALADFLPIYGRSALLTIAAVAAPALLMTHYRFAASTPLPLVVASIAAGAIGWCAGLALLRHPILAEATPLLRKLRRQPARND